VNRAAVFLIVALKPGTQASSLSAMPSILVAVLLLAASCAADSAKPQLADLGRACDATHPCAAGTECGTCGIGTGQCVAPCSVSGFAGCPSGSFCSRAWSDTDVHICVRECVRDTDCSTPTANPGLSCNDPYLDPGTSVNDVAICNVDNSIASTHACR